MISRPGEDNNDGAAAAPVHVAVMSESLVCVGVSEDGIEDEKGQFVWDVVIVLIGVTVAVNVGLQVIVFNRHEHVTVLLFKLSVTFGAALTQVIVFGMIIGERTAENRLHSEC